MHILIKVVIVIGIVVFGGYGLRAWMNARTFQSFGELVYKKDVQEKVVALTFDDGPTDKTPRILKLLDEQNVRVTFFVVGRDVAQNQDLVKSIIEQGNEVGNHSYTHQRMVFKSPRFIEQEISKTDIEIRKAGYQREIHFRPPYGKKLLILPWQLKKLNKKTIMWSVEVDSSQTSDAIAQYVNSNVMPGSIVLLHPMYNESDLGAIPKIIITLKERGYRFVTVSELLAL